MRSKPVTSSGRIDVLVRGGVDHRVRDLPRAVPLSGASQALGDQRVVVRPHGADVIPDRVVSGVVRRHRANPPSAPHRSREKVLHEGADPDRAARAPTRGGDPCSRSSRRSGGRRRRARARRSHRAHPARSHSGNDRRGCRPTREASAKNGVTDHPSREVGRTPPRVDHVALDLRERDGRVRDRPVVEPDRVPRVLPTLVHEADLRTRPVLEVAGGRRGESRLDPSESPEDVAPQLSNEIGVPGPTLVLGEHDQPQGGRVDRPVVRIEGELSGDRERARSDLVEDLPGSSSRKWSSCSP